MIFAELVERQDTTLPGISIWNFADDEESELGTIIDLDDYIGIESKRLWREGKVLDRFETSRTIRSLLYSAEMLTRDVANPHPDEILANLLHIPVNLMLWRSHPSISRGVWYAIENRWGLVPWKN